jgi:hypothetical protein
MERQVERVAGLDVHRDTVAACVRAPGRGGRRDQHVHTFGTTTGELLRLRDWLEGHEVSHVAMGSTEVYWRRLQTAERGSEGREARGRHHAARGATRGTALRGGGATRAGRAPARPARSRRGDARG